MNMPEIKNLTALKGLFALFVIVGHYEPLVQSLPGYSLNIIMACFFTLSGFCLALNYTGRILAPGFSYKDFIIRRFSKIYPIQWLIVILYVLFGINVVTYWAVPFHLTLTQSLCPFWEINFTLNAATWFLSTTVILYLFFPVIIRCYNWNKRLLTALYGIGLVIMALGAVFLPETIGRKWLYYINPGARFFDFALGILLADIYARWRHKEHSSSVLVSTFMEAVALFLFFAFVFGSYVWPGEYYRPVQVLYPFIILLILVFSLQGNGCFSMLFRTKLFQTLGGASLCIYMIHGFVISLISRSPLPWYINTVLIYIVVLVCSYFLNRYFIPWSSSVFQKLAYKWTSKR